MKRLILAVLALLFAVSPVLGASGAPQPGYYFDNGILRIVLGSKPCKVPGVLKLVKPAAHPEYHSAELVYQGQPLAACWRYMPNYGAVFVIDESGEYGPVAAGLFKKPVSI
jgi:hypothetical protein